MKSKIITAWKILVNYFFYTGRPEGINPIYFFRQVREGFSVQKIRKKYPDLYKEICGLIAKSGSTGGEWSDYLVLYEEIRTKKPKRILEMGSGISSLIICFAIEENKKENCDDAKFFSVEENEHYHNQIVGIFPEKYTKLVRFLLCERKQKRYRSTLGSYYEDLPQEDFDFIFVDGPTERIKPHDEKSFNADLVNLIDRDQLTKVNGLLDQRITTYWALKKLLPKLRIRYSVNKKVSFFSFQKSG
ncbi:hypothetical protein OAL14_00360 [Gammaproteobacteria bacterium]|nr:hypothetical protein [Gammaproteobacteria bacterium]